MTASGFDPAGPWTVRALPDPVKRILINHLSPVLLGYKPAALFMAPRELLRGFLPALLPRRLSLRVLREGKAGLLVMVFDREKLETAIARKSARAILNSLGYPAGAPVWACLEYLKQKLAYSRFPHEIGLFLGYPAEDVLGFVKHRGRNYKLCGYWKVYGDVERAKCCFRQYDTCRDRLRIVFLHPGNRRCHKLP
ncbi:MAG: DUF3793 family protein [Spirochaetaceae bacterium]|nr:DUF3793 family protein [Spirochaetaceae bacterium]